MTYHSSGSQNEGKRDIRRFLLTKSCIHAGSTIKSRAYVCTHFHASKSAYMWENLFLVCGIESLVFGPMVLDHGILSEVLNPGIGSMVLILYGFGLWY